MLTPAEAGAGVCLDGSPPALYYVAAKSAAYNASWVVMLQGGGWCVDEASCAERSRTSLGSTAQLAAKQRSLRVGGILHGLALRNPDFHAFHRVLLHYCDGGSFTGDRDVGALHLRGRAVLDAQLRRLEAMGLSDAERVLFGGFSAGGLGAAVHADAVRARLRRVRQFGVLAASGFFWPGAGADAPSSRWSSGPFLQRLYDFHRSGGSLHPNCLMQQPAEGCGAASTRARRSRRRARRYSSRTRRWTRGSSSTCGARTARAPPAASRGATPTRCAASIASSAPLSTACAAPCSRAPGTAPSSPRARSTRARRSFEVGDRRRAAPPRAPPLVGGAARRARRSPRPPPVRAARRAGQRLPAASRRARRCARAIGRRFVAVVG